MSSHDRPLSGSQPPKPSRLPLIALMVVALGAFLAGAWNQELWSSREGRVASCAQGMLDTGDWLVPRISTGSQPRFEKPPLAYWLAASFGLLFGAGRVTPLAAKLPSVLAGLGTVLLIFSLGARALGSRRAGMFAALALTTTALFWDEAHTSAADMPMVFFMVLAVFGFWRVIEQDRHGQLDRMLPWLALGLGFLTKGPVALAVPLVAVIGYLCLTGRYRKLPEVIPSPLGLIAFAAVALPWYLAVMHKHPEALGTWLGESFGRFDEDSTSHQEPFHYYLSGAFWAATAPWVGLLPAMVAALLSGREEKKPLPAGLILAGCWVLLGLLLFSLSSSKRQYYLLALTPGFALAVGWVLERYAENRIGSAGRLLVKIPMIIMGLTLLAGPVIAPLLPGLIEKYRPGEWPADLQFQLFPLVCFGLIGLMLTFMGFMPALKRPPLVQGVLAASAALLIWSGLTVLPALNGRKAPAEFCARVRQKVPRGEKIYSVKASKFPLLAYYLGRNRIENLDRSEFDALCRQESGGYGIAERHDLLKWIEKGRVSAKIVLEDSGDRKSRPVLFEWHRKGNSRVE